MTTYCNDETKVVIMGIDPISIGFEVVMRCLIPSDFVKIQAVCVKLFCQRTTKLRALEHALLKPQSYNQIKPIFDGFA